MIGGVCRAILGIDGKTVKDASLLVQLLRQLDQGGFTECGRLLQLLSVFSAELLHRIFFGILKYLIGGVRLQVVGGARSRSLVGLLLVLLDYLL